MWIVNALFPEFCVRCKGEGSVFCSSCRAAWNVEPIVDHELFSLGSYKDRVLQTLLGLWKYHNVQQARAALLTIVEQTALDYRWAFPEVEAVTFVPLHWRKANERGFDQAEEIAKCVAESLGVPCRALLERTRYTAQQAQIDRERRDQQEFDGVFRSLPHVNGQILLVDDVWTTGTTIGSAAAALKAAGAASVSAFTIARG